METLLIIYNKKSEKLKQAKGDGTFYTFSLFYIQNKNKMETKSSIKTVNPTTGVTEKVFEEMSSRELNSIIENADNAFFAWKNTSFAYRADLFKKLASLMIQKKDVLAKLCAIEMGKKISEGVSEIQISHDILNYYADNGEEFMTDKLIDVQYGKAYVTYEPIGVILCIEPWNFPFYQIVRAVAATIMAGNTVIVKQASNVPQCGAMMEQLFTEAGFPKGVYTNIFLAGSKTSPLIADSRIKGAALTGSEKAGASLATTAGQYVKKVTLELGGSDPLIVLEDADIDVAVKNAAYGRLMVSGQVCISPKRIIVLESIADEFIQKAKTIYQNIKIGDPLDPETELAPLSSESALLKVLDQVNKTVEQGASLVYGGRRLGRDGFFMEPTILTDIKPEMPVYYDEVFGPVLCVYKVKDDNEAIAVANSTKFGLGGSVFTKDTDRAEKIARMIDSGMIYINHTTTHAPQFPFGGTKNSGYGRELSELGIHEFVNQKLIRVTNPDQAY